MMSALRVNIADPIFTPGEQASLVDRAGRVSNSLMLALQLDMRVAYSAFPVLSGQSIKSSLIVRCLPPPMYPLSPGQRHRCGPNGPGCRAVRVGRASRVSRDQREG